jgi:hypothetical protein
MGAVAGQRRECFDLGGKWIPGFDISGHIFILLYSILLISEEASSFRNWPTTPRAVADKRELNKIEHDSHKKKTRTVQWLFLGLFLVHLVWVGIVHKLKTSLFSGLSNYYYFALLSRHFSQDCWSLFRCFILVCNLSFVVSQLFPESTDFASKDTLNNIGEYKSRFIYWYFIKLIF